MDRKEITSYTKDKRDGWRARTVIELGPVPEGTRVLEIGTHKLMSGGIGSRATVMVDKDNGSRVWLMGGDFSARLAQEPQTRCTEANIIALHRRVLEGKNAIIAQALAHYPDMAAAQAEAVPA